MKTCRKDKQVKASGKTGSLLCDFINVQFGKEPVNPQVWKYFPDQLPKPVL
jgi:hypothetical protein